MSWARSILLGLLLASGRAWAAETNAPAPEVIAKREYDLGLTFLNNSQFAGAIEAFQRAALLQPEFADPYAQWGIALIQIGKISPTPQQQLEAYRVAAEKLARASSMQVSNTVFLLRWAESLNLIGDLPVEGRVKLACYQGALDKYRRVTELVPSAPEGYLQWGTLLTSKLPQFAVDDKARAQLHQSAAEMLAKAVERAKFSAELGPAYVMWGTALARQGRYTTDLNTKKKLMRDSVAKFESAARAVPNTASTYALWGAAALELGKLTRSRAEYRDAASHLSTSLALNPHDAATLYTLACAYALLDSTPLAITTLRTCFEKDLAGTYRSAAPTEADLASLRGNPDFEELLASKARAVVAPYNPPLRNGPR